MITFLKGKLVDKRPTHISVDVEGVGYEINIPLSTFDTLPDIDEPVKLLTHLYVREDTHRLYGFMTEQERELFRMLLSISGIGPRMGLAILSGGPVERFKAAVAGGDAGLLTAIPGIGRKTAERIILELKEKLGGLDEPVAGAPETEKAKGYGDAVLALVSLGYKQKASREAVKKALASGEKELSVEELIRQALKCL